MTDTIRHLYGRRRPGRQEPYPLDPWICSGHRVRALVDPAAEILEETATEFGYEQKCTTWRRRWTGRQFDALVITAHFHPSRSRCDGG